MKTIGMLGGMSWESTVTYYRIVNQVVKERLGGLHSAKVLLHSVEFAEIERCQSSGDWEGGGAILARAARGLEAAGADVMVICTNTMHKVAPQIEAAIGIPLLHIADATAGAVMERGVRRVGLLGTKYTMTQDFYRHRIEAAGIEVIIPPEADVELVNRVIFEELCLGRIEAASKAEFLRIAADLEGRGAGGIILGCTEIGLLISQDDLDLPVFDTTLIHARKAALLALEG